MTSTCERIKLDPYLTPYTEVNSKWTKAINVRAETINPQGKNMAKYLGDLELSNAFSGRTPKT